MMENQDEEEMTHYDKKEESNFELSDDIIGFDNDKDMNDDMGDEIEMEEESIRALTLKDHVDYEDNAMNEVEAHHYAPGYTEKDDLNHDGIIDNLENQLKVIGMKDDIRDIVDDKIKGDYLKKFRKEVDFHHKVAYRFEKAYRLGKKMTTKKKAMNMEIIEIISEHSDYLEQDPMSLFYCLYFCIYYKNPNLVEFMRTLINKMDPTTKPERIDQMLEYIDQNGIDVLRTQGEKINTHIYHMVFYQAVDDELRIVYAQILHSLKYIQLRDCDALHLLKQRDYELIRVTFNKIPTKIAIT